MNQEEKMNDDEDTKFKNPRSPCRLDLPIDDIKDCSIQLNQKMIMVCEETKEIKSQITRYRQSTKVRQNQLNKMKTEEMESERRLLEFSSKLFRMAELLAQIPHLRTRRTELSATIENLQKEKQIGLDDIERKFDRCTQEKTMEFNKKVEEKGNQAMVELDTLRSILAKEESLGVKDIAESEQENELVELAAGYAREIARAQEVVHVNCELKVRDLNLQMENLKACLLLGNNNQD